MNDDTIAHYRIGSKLGEGGMGEVYQATDTKLHREVALKFLPEALTQDPETLERFRREARALATLSHPNIGVIHGIEESHGRVALVLELVEGDTLAERIAAGTLERNELFRIAEQVAAGLEAAHEQGIVHRDLKPANIKITPEGQAKVLDFGLAKSIQAETRTGGGVAESPTIMMTAAQPGVVMGTAPYMSPEQAKGAPVDRRADIWAYGAVLFEMFSGQRLFEGDDVTEVLAAVISTEPDLSRLPGDVPRWLRDLIGRCLRRDVRMRLPHMAAARICLQEANDEVDDAVVAAAAAAAATNGVGWVLVVATLLVGLGLGAFGSRLLVPAESDPVGSVQYTELILDPPPFAGALPAISPDGRLIAYPGGDATHRSAIFIRNLGDGTTGPLPGSEYGEVPVFSPDSRAVAFMAAGILRAGVLGGGRPVPIAAVSGAPNGAVWLPDDTIVISTQGSRQLQRVAATGGVPVPVEIRADRADEIWITDPVALPGSESLLVTIDGPDTDGAQIAALSLRDGELTRIVSGSNPRLVGATTLIFLRRGDLVAAPFDAAALALSGPERSLSPPGTVVLTQRVAGGEQLVGAIHPAGFALLPMEAAEQHQLVWVDRSGQESPTGVRVGSATGEIEGSGVDLSPDGTRVALVVGAPVIIDLNDVTQRRVLPRPGPTSSYPRWDPKGEHIAVISNEAGAFHSYRIAAGGGTPPERFTDTPSSIGTSFFPDGESVLGYVVTGETGRDLWVFHLDGEDELLLRTAANERAPMLSPDGRAYAYVSDESGEDRIYLRLFPDVGQAWEISGNGANEPRWSRDGGEVFFVENGRMMAVSVDLSDGLRHGESRDLFGMGPYMFDPFGNATYDVAEDGRFIMMRLGAGPRTWRWVQNWGADLDRIVNATE